MLPILKTRCLMPKVAKKRRVIRVDELAIPTPIGAEDFVEICRTSRIPLSHQQTLRAQLDELVKAFAIWMGNERGQADRPSDRDQLEEVISQIKKAAFGISKLGPSGRRALRIAARSVAPMLSARWINDRFPDDDFAPQQVAVPKQSGARHVIRTNLRAEKYFIEEYSLEARDRFVRNRAVQVAGAILEAIEAGIRQSLKEIDRQPGARGGRKPLRYRHYLLVNLAKMWSELGREVSTGPKSEFSAFCESIAVTIGWPYEGLAAAIPRALNDRRNRS
jgi:hypothetical protein